MDRSSYQEYRNLLNKTKQARVGQIILSGIHEPTEEDEAGKSWTDLNIRNLTSVWKQELRIQEFGEDSCQRDSTEAVWGRGGFVGQLRGERRNVYDRWSAY